MFVIFYSCFEILLSNFYVYAIVANENNSSEEGFAIKKKETKLSRSIFTNKKKQRFIKLHKFKAEARPRA